MNGLHFGVGRRPGYLLLSALVGLGAVVALVLSYRHLAAQSTLKHATQSNVALTRIFARAVWSRYEHLVAEAPESSRERMSRRPELTQLRRDVRDHIRDTRIVKVKLYDPHGLTVFSTNGSQIGEDKSGNQGVVKARRGEVASLITRRDTMDTFEGEVTDRHIISTYVPISNRSSGRVLAVFAVYSDVTELINGIDRDTGYVLVGVLGSVLILYAVILVIAGSAHRVVREEHQQRIVAEAEIKYQAYHDPLTGLRNRRSFNEELDALLSRSGERPEKLAVMFLDVDNFKLINDGFGHSVGDEVLRTIARRLTDCLRFEDRLYHMSADEFTIVLGGQDIRNATHAVVEGVLKRMAEPVTIDGQSATVTLSIGVSMYPDDGQDGEQLLKAADSAMYRAKDSGRNRYKFHTPGATASAIERLTMESELWRAAETNQFMLYYQPRVFVASGEIVAVEALIRWPRPETGVVAPCAIIPFLERNGLIENVGRWVLKSACEQLRTWLDSGVDYLRVSVNVSPRQFLHPGFVQTVKQTIAETGVPADHIELELTESMLLDINDDTTRKLELLKDLGTSITMDDFGTGYSSLNYLRCMSIDYLKIDKTFISRITDDPRDAAVVSAILSLAHKLGVRVVAEGVETQKQLEFLYANACEEYQGFLYSEPVPPLRIDRLFQAARFRDNTKGRRV